MTGKYSKIITLAPIVWALLFLTVDFVFDEFTITESQVSLIEFLLASTILGGTANAGYKRFIKYKENNK